MNFLQNLLGVIFTGALIVAFFVCILAPSAVILDVGRHVINLVF